MHDEIMRIVEDAFVDGMERGLSCGGRGDHVSPSSEWYYVRSDYEERASELAKSAPASTNSGSPKCSRCGSVRWKQVSKTDNECLDCGEQYPHFA